MATGMAKEKSKIRLGVLFGGRSGEHEVSLLSAASVIGALDPAAFDVTALGITRDGRLAGSQELEGMLPVSLHSRVRMLPGAYRADSRPPISALFAERAGADAFPEIIFPLLHGPYGEDGTIQGLLEIIGLPYIGCGVLASAIGMDKDVQKRLFLQASLPVVPFRVQDSRELAARMDALRSEIEAEFGYPVFSKPANLGSSVGVCKIHSAAEFAPAVLCSARFDRKIIIEKGIDARELECAILGNEDAEASPVGEIIPACEFYDYEAKYVNSASRTQVPADIDPGQAEEVRKLALRSFAAIDGSGLARVDFFLDRKTGNIWLNEINTMPGFTSISMYPKLWAASGIPFDSLIRRLVDLGLARHRERTVPMEAQVRLAER
jgi:D-alanine-D-alanine ligase